MLLLQHFVIAPHCNHVSLQGSYRGTVAAFPGWAGGGMCTPWAEAEDPADTGVVCCHPRPCPLHPRYWSGHLTDWRIGSLFYLCLPRWAPPYCVCMVVDFCVTFMSYHNVCVFFLNQQAYVWCKPNYQRQITDLQGEMLLTHTVFMLCGCLVPFATIN